MSSIAAADSPTWEGPLRCDLLDPSWDAYTVANYPTLDYSQRDVRRAGDALRGSIAWESEDQQQEALKIFAIASSWRDSHAFPMVRLRNELGGHLQKTSLRQSGITAARLKRMNSIRRKLKIRPEGLNQIQDLAGCRVIIPSIEDVRKLVRYNRENSKHEWFKDWDYIEKPKIDGYRCFHRVYKFNGTGEGEEVFHGRRVEIQIRTRLQHSWATAVEAVGLYRGEDFKGGSGDPDWRWLFALMSSEFAAAEGCPELAGAPPRKDRIREIRFVGQKLEAVQILENLSQASNYTDMYAYEEKTKYFLIEYNKQHRTVRVRPYSNSISGTESLDNIEAEIRSGTKVNAVLVEADKIDALRAAYPNYFGDVQVFKASLRRIIEGRNVEEYTLPPQQTLPPLPNVVADTAWFRCPRFRPPKGA